MSLSASIPVYLITYNCARLPPNPKIVADHLLSAADPNSPAPEILAIGLQEFAPLSYAFIGGDYIRPYLDTWSSTIRQAHSSLAPNHKGEHEYVEVGRRHVGMTALFIFSNRPDRIKSLDFAVTGFGFWGMANKGAVGVKIGYLRGGRGSSANEADEEITIVTAHLAAHEQLCARRNEDWEALVRGMVFSVKNLDRTNPSEDESEQTPLLQDTRSSETPRSISGIYSPKSHLLVMGDLNYRTSDISPLPESAADFPAYDAPLEEFQRLFKKDQLSIHRTAGSTLHGFAEAEITFPPTYKLKIPFQPLTLTDPKDLMNQSSEPSQPLPPTKPTKSPYASHRWPSWCDRILYLPTTPSFSSKLSPPSSEPIQIHNYSSLSQITGSDHLPVALHISLPPLSVSLPPTKHDWDLRYHPPFPLDSDWKARRETAETKELVVGYAILLVTTVGGLVVITCAVLGVGTLWWAMGGQRSR